VPTAADIAKLNDSIAKLTAAADNYFLNGDGLLMPAKKDQAPPDLRYFKQTTK
jgi:hypothetical protein